MHPSYLSVLTLIMLTTATAGTEHPTFGKATHQTDGWNPGTYMRQAIETVVATSISVTKGTKLGLAENISVFGSLLQRRGKASIAVSLEAGTSYVVIAGGDDFVKDVDVRLKDAAGTVLRKDEDDDESAVVSYTPSRSGQYTLTVELFDAPEPSFVAMAIFSNDGWNVKTSNLNDAASSLMRSGSIIAQKNAAGFMAVEGQWALFGSVLKPKDRVSVTNFRLEGRPYAFIATCDGLSDDIDLFLKKSGATVDKDDDDDANPIIIASPKGTHALEMVNSGDKTSLVFMAVLEIDEKVDTASDMTNSLKRSW